MRVKLLTALSGPALNLVPGDEHEFDDAEGQRFIDAGFAEAVETDQQRLAREQAEAKAQASKAAAKG